MGRRAMVLGSVLLAASAIAVIAAASSRETPRDTGVLLVQVADGARERLTPIEGAATWSRDGRRVFVSAEPDGTSSQPFAVFAGGRRVVDRVLRSAEVASDEVAISPGEQRIAYVRAARDPDHLNTGDLAVGRLESGAPDLLLTRAFGKPAWSPDGRHVAVGRLSRREARGLIGRRDVPERIAIVSSTGRGAVRPAGPGGSPIWLPDGRLLVSVDGQRSTELVVMRADGSGRRTVLRDVRGGSWEVSPDGRQVAVAAAGEGSPHYHVSVIDLADGSSRRVSDETAGDVTWSPRGDRLAATVGDRIVLIDPTGQAPEQTLTQIPRCDLRYPAWSPDGTQIAVMATVHRPYRD